jgi:hypothetical protein
MNDWQWWQIFVLGCGICGVIGCGVGFVISWCLHDGAAKSDAEQAADDEEQILALRPNDCGSIDWARRYQEKQAGRLN